EYIDEFYTRNDWMMYLDTQLFAVGREDNTCMDVICSVDPMGTHVEVYYLDDRIMFKKLPPEKHWLARDLTKWPISSFVGEASIIDISDVKAEENKPLKDIIKERSSHLKQGDIVLCKTDYNEKFKGNKMSGEYYEKSFGPGPEALQWLVDEKNMKAFGIDARGPEDRRFKDIFKDVSKLAYPAHRVLHDNNVPIIEVLANLHKTSEKRLFLFCGTPVKAEKLSGGPTTVIGIEMNTGKIVDFTTYSKSLVGVNANKIQRIEPSEQDENIHRRLRIQKMTAIGLGYRYPNGMEEWGEIMSFSSHLGTHIEVPFLNTENRPLPKNILKSVSDLKYTQLCGPATVLDLTNKIPTNGEIKLEHLKEYDNQINSNDIVVLRTDFSDWNYNIPGNYKLSPKLTMKAAEWLIEKQVKMIITDFTSVDGSESAKENGGKVRHSLFQNNIPIVNMATNLWMLRKTRLFLACLPLSITGLDASPVRLIAVEEYGEKNSLLNLQLQD
ncbi:MAG TPA: cyclase family protein, partial [Atribacterota bacterium]|nr:cyclase family protein [Atribacterota bacterium]